MLPCISCLLIKSPLIQHRDERNSRGTTLISHVFTRLTWFAACFPCVHRISPTFVITGRFRQCLLLCSAVQLGRDLRQLSCIRLHQPRTLYAKKKGLLAPSSRDMILIVLL